MNSPKTILIVQIGKLGDMILTTPLFQEIKKIFPETTLTVLSSNLNKVIAENNPYVNKVLIYKKNIQNNLLLYFSTLRNQDIWIDTKDTYSRTSEILLKLFKPKLSLGFNIDKKIFDIDLKNFKSGNHATDINLSPVAYFTNSDHKKINQPEIEIPEDIKIKIDPLINADKNYKNIVINFSAGDISRYINSDVWVEVINSIMKTGKYFIYITGLEKDFEKTKYIVDKVNTKNVKLFPTKNIMETAELIRRSNLTLTPDTSVVHLCSAFNIPVIAIYPDIKWNLEKFYPLSGIKEIIVSEDSTGITDVYADQITDAFMRIYEYL